MRFWRAEWIGFCGERMGMLYTFGMGGDSPFGLASLAILPLKMEIHE